jgi:hypothetical protein
VTAKSPHPSGRPVRVDEKKSREVRWNCPLEQPATPRLRPKIFALADAVGYHRVQEHDGTAPDECRGLAGFVHFDEK